MMPGNVLSLVPLPSVFLAPRDQLTKQPNPPAGFLPLTDYTLGGVDFDDPSQGMRVKTWTAQVDGSGNVTVSAPSVAPQVIFTRAGITWIGLAFDSNMKSVLTWLDGSGAWFRFFDPVGHAYSVVQLPVGSDRVFAQLDDARPLETSTSDVLLHYMRASHLYMRMQRDRYLIEYDLGLLTGLLLTQTGMNHTNRFQFQF